MKLANERGVLVEDLGWRGCELAAVGVLRENGEIGAQSVEPLLAALHESDAVRETEPAAALDRARALAHSRGLLVQRDEGALKGWIEQVIAGNSRAAVDVRAGKVQAVGRLVGEVMKLSGGSADAKTVRDALLKALGQG
jgi:aspartyl-tRNA(Asn)/glutamyl-tRNA(Gln) amidotransferase subunit B